MSNIARILCDKVVEPALDPSRDSSTKRSSSKFMKHFPTTRSIVVEKKKEINNLLPNNKNAIENKYKSKEFVVRKNFTDKAANTTVTGPLKCDTNCLTMVRKRASKCNFCKCAPKNPIATKQAQTFGIKSFFHTDKASSQCVQTASCGTQFMEMLNLHGSENKKNSKDILKPNSSLKSVMKIRPEDSTTSKSGLINYMGARRWALSQYHPRGPDF